SGVYFNLVIGTFSQNTESPTNPVRFSYKFLLFLKEIKKPVPFLGEKKAQQSRKDCAWHISSFIVAKFLVVTI
ncbi:hypothetical protein ABTG30_18080, partial [Acinetobacter baumannii]